MSRFPNSNRGGNGGGNNNGGGGGGGGGGNGGANSAAAGGGDAILGNGQMAFLTSNHKKVFSDIFRSPVEDPREAFEGLQYPPDIYEIYTIDVPVGTLEANATSFSSITRAQRDFESYKHAALIASLCVTNPAMGTPPGIDMDAANNNGNMGAPGMGGQQLNAPAQAQGQRQGRGNFGNNNNHVVGDRDIRGNVENEGHDLLFTYRGQRIDRVHVYIEEVCNEAGEILKYRIWFFIYDRGFNMGEAIEQVLHQNHSIYGRNDAVQSDGYISHSGIQNVSQYVKFVVLPYLEQGINLRMSDGVRDDLKKLTKMLENPENIVSSMIPLHNPEHIVNPRRIFGKVNTFALGNANVCREQADPAEYFDLVSSNRIASGAGGSLGDAIRADMDGAELDEGADLVVGGPSTTTPGNNKNNDPDDPMDIDDEIDALLGLANERERNYVVDGEEHRRITTVEDASSQVDTAALIDRPMINKLRHTPDNEFSKFPVPERVVRIGTANFGRRWMRMPLPHIMKRLQNGSLTGNNSLHTSIIEVYSDVAKNDTEERITAMTPEERKAELKGILDELGPAHQPSLPKNVYTDPDVYLRLLKDIRVIQTTVRDEKNTSAARREVLEWLESAVEPTYQNSDEDSLSRGYVFGGLLPENLNGRLSTSDFRDFMKKYDFFKYRMSNFLERSRLNCKYNVETQPEEYSNALEKFSKRAARDTWDSLMTSMNLPKSDTSMRDWFSRQPASEQWGEHLDLITNLSTYANMKIKQLSRYTYTFRGSVNHNVYMISQIVYHAGFLYDWGLRLHLIQVGKASLGKSHVYECLEVQAVPGSFEVLGHRTEREGTGNEVCIHATVCMHEAPLSLVGVDRLGREVVADPVLKDKLTRCRTTTRTYGTDKDGNRLTKEYQAIHMTNTLMATNEVVPPEESPLMTRFIVMVVNNMKRPDFNAADSNTPLGDLVNSREDMVQIHHSQLFAWYIFVTCQFIMTGVIPDVSMDAAEILVKEILSDFSRRTGIPTSQTRKRKMVMDMIKTKTLEYGISTALFSNMASLLSQYKDSESGRLLFKPFDPELIVTEVAKYLYTTDEIVADVLTLVSFMWEYEHRFAILDAIVARTRRSPHEQPHFTRREAPTFRMMANPNNMGYTNPFNQRGKTNNTYQSNLNSQNNNNNNNNGGRSNFPNRGQSNANMSSLTRNETAPQEMPPPASRGGFNNGGNENDDDDDDDEDIDTVSAFVQDPRYAVIRGSELSDIHSTISAHIKTNTPSENEVQRTLRDLSKVTYEAHEVTLEIDDGEPDPLSKSAKKKRNDQASVDGNDEMSSDTEFGMFNQFRKGVNAAAKKIDTLTPGGNKLKGRAKRAAMMRPQTKLVWKIDMNSPTHPERVVIIERNPMRPMEWQVGVLIEYLSDDRHKDAMVKSIINVLSTDSIPEGGRDLITSIPYVNKDGVDLNGKPEKVEVMPQFLKVLHIPRNPNKRLTATFVNIGTLDSEVFTRSSLRSQHLAMGNDNDYGIGRKLSSKMGITFSEKHTINQYSAFRHWLRLGKSPRDNGWTQTLPDVVTAVNRKLMKSAAASETANVTLIDNYPQECVEDYVIKRQIIQMVNEGNINDDCLETSESLITSIMERSQSSSSSFGNAAGPTIQYRMPTPDESIKSRMGDFKDRFHIIGEPDGSKSAKSLMKKKQDTVNVAKKRLQEAMMRRQSDREAEEARAESQRQAEYDQAEADINEQPQSITVPSNFSQKRNKFQNILKQKNAKSANTDRNDSHSKQGTKRTRDIDVSDSKRLQKRQLLEDESNNMPLF